MTLLTHDNNATVDLPLSSMIIVIGNFPFWKHFDHQLIEITIIISLPLVTSYHVGFGIWIGIIFVWLSVFNLIHGQPLMFTLITWIQHAHFRFRVKTIFLYNTVGVKRDIFRFAHIIQPFTQQWSVFADLAQACVLGYLVIINVLFTSFDELVEKTEG